MDLKSAHMTDAPAIYPNYLATKTDCDTLVKGIQIARRIAKHEPLKTIISDEYSPGYSVNEDDYDTILDWARRFVFCRGSG